MSDEANATDETEAAPKSKKKLVIGIVLLNVLAIGGLGAFVLLGSSSTASAEAADTAAADATKSGKSKDAKDEGTKDGEDEEAEAALPGEGMLGPTDMVGKFTINLADRTTSRYLRLVVKAEVSSSPTKDEMKNRNPQLRHIAIAYLSSLRIKDTQGPGALERIGAELQRRFNHVLTTGEVKQIYFTDFVTQ